MLDAPTTTARLTEAIQTAAPHLRSILLAVRDYRVALMIVPQGPDPFAIPAKADRAAVILIGDDMHRSTGPEGFHLPSVRRAIRACHAFVVVAGEPANDLYAGGTAVAVGGKHAMIIETRPEHEIQWVSMIQKLAPKRPLMWSTVKGGTA